MEVPEYKREIVNSGLFMVYVVGFVATAVFLSLFFGKGIESELFFKRATLYLPLLITFASGITILGVFGAIIKHWGGELYRRFGWLGSSIVEPEEGLLWQFKFLRKFLSSFSQQILFGIILFSLLGLVYATQNTFLNELPFQIQVGQQVTEGSIIFSSIEPASTTETLILMFFNGLLFSIAKWLRYKYKWSQSTTFAFKLLIFPVSIIMWIAFHFFVYGSSDLALSSVALFAFITTAMYFLTGSILFSVLHHQFNNGFIALNELFSNDIIKVITLVIVLVSLSLFLFLTVIQRNRKSALEVSSNG